MLTSRAAACVGSRAVSQHSDCPFRYTASTLSTSLEFYNVIQDTKPTCRCFLLRSIYFMWLKNDLNSLDYQNACVQLNAELGQEGKAGGEVKRILFGEKAEIIAWLDGADDCQYIRPLSQEAQKVQDELDKASAAASGAASASRPTAGLGGAGIDPKLKEIYNGERRMGDRNSVLRGIKPTVSKPAMLPPPEALLNRLTIGFLTHSQAR